MKVLVTCPPMLKSIERFRHLFSEKGIELICPEFVQTLSVSELVKLVPTVEGWIIGDDPATAEVFQTGAAGKLKAAVKWGVGTDNVDFKAAETLGIPISNTPQMFGEEVSDVALAYVLALTRNIISIDKEVKKGNWVKPICSSLTHKRALVVGYGDIGRCTARKLAAFKMAVSIYDPFVSKIDDNYTLVTDLKSAASSADFLVVTCALTRENRHLINYNLMKALPQGSRIINVSRGPLIDETALIELLKNNHIAGAGLDVFEEEPLSKESPLTKFDNVIVGSHNGSNTYEAVERASLKAIELLFGFLKVK